MKALHNSKTARGASFSSLPLNENLKMIRYCSSNFHLHQRLTISFWNWLTNLILVRLHRFDMRESSPWFVLEHFFWPRGKLLLALRHIPIIANTISLRKNQKVWERVSKRMTAYNPLWLMRSKVKGEQCMTSFDLCTASARGFIPWRKNSWLDNRRII